ncbi:hypothetical protein HYW44_05205 [Candidatus Daviesbacteria bacterium]|nr:hypothetical protein [Candidatus Daviesbacteria bacterium]
MRDRLIHIAKFSLCVWVFLFIYSYIWTILKFQGFYLWFSMMTSILLSFGILFVATKKYYENNPSLREKSWLSFGLGVVIFDILYSTLFSELFRLIKLENFYAFSYLGGVVLILPIITGVSLGSSKPISKIKIIIAALFLIFSMFQMTFVGKFYGEF